MRIKLLCLSILFFTGWASAGWASAGMNGGCMHIVANGTYAGSANGAMNGCICHMGCIGFNCPKPDYTALAAMEVACVNAANNVTATVPITVAVTPTAPPTR